MENTPLHITGLSCQACVNHVERALLSVPGVEAAQVDLDSGRATVRHRGAIVADLVRAVESEGYEAQPLAPEQ